MYTCNEFEKLSINENDIFLWTAGTGKYPYFYGTEGVI